MDQLLKCGLCSERFRNPKLLPCNHTFCAEPCLERNVERSKQQLKCPECSAEHRIPIQGFPNNVTLVRFLELRQQVSGHEPELPASMQRCNTCAERGQLQLCAHCNRKVCADCKAAHVNILRKEIFLINQQVREGLHQLSNTLHSTEENADKLQKNYIQVKDEIEEVVRRYTRDLMDTEAKLKHHLDLYLQSELKSMRRLEHDLQVELTNVNSNCDLVDKYVNNGTDWTDAELTDYKEIFQKTLEFLRAFDSDPTDCIRKVKFHARSDPDVIHKTIVDFAEVKLNDELLNGQDNVNGNCLNNGPTVVLTPPQSNALSRSQSDHKLAGQRKSTKKGEWQPNEESAAPSPFSKRLRERLGKEDKDASREDGHHYSWRRELDDARTNSRHKYASREGLDEVESYENENSSSSRRVGFRTPEEGRSSPSHERVAETEDATKGPLSGVIRIQDSPHVMERLHHSQLKQKKQKEEEERKARMPKPAPPVVSRPMTRQLSEDEIEKQKKENKAAAAAASSTAKATFGVDSYSRNSRTNKDESHHSTPANPIRSTEEPRSRQTRNTTEDTRAVRNQRDVPQTTSPPASRLRNWREKEVSESPPGSPTRSNRDVHKPPVSPRQRELPQTRPSGRSYLSKNSSLEDDSPTDHSSSQRRTTFSPSAPVVGRLSPHEKKEESRPRLRLTMPIRHPSPSDSSSSSSESESEDDVDSEAAAKRGDISPSVNTLLARSAQARKQSASTQARILGRQDDKSSRPSSRNWRDSIRKEDERDKKRKSSVVPEPEERLSPYSRLLSERRRSSVTAGSRFRDVSPEDNSYSARRNRISRSKSSHDLCPAEDSPEDDSLTAIRNRYRSRIARDKSPEEAPHTWSQYLKNKYGATGRSGLMRSRTSSSLAAPRSGSDNSSEDEIASRRRDYGRRGDSNSPRGFSLPRRTYMQKGKTCFKFGSRGTEHGLFTWPRGVCVGSDNTIVVADSNNHRVQVFSSSGKFLNEFGSYGSNEGEFDCLAAVTVNRIGQFIVSDRYNHRLQVFDPTGRFVRSFGCEGRVEGKFSYPWGVATDNLGFIYVCDKENHRVQVFQGDGTYVTRFGGIGQRPGELEHPHYVAVSTTNRVIVSDSNNHRIQIFDVNGRLLSTFGTEGSEEGQFKYPRGVAVDDQGYLIIGDSGNNRIQIFHPDGTFLKAFGCWGSGDAEFKGLEGIAVNPSGQILVCDRENHRIQVF